MVEPLVFMRQADGRVLVVGDTWPREVELSRELVENPSEHFMTIEDGQIEFTVFNGCAFYEILGNVTRAGFEEVMVARLMTGSIGYDR